MIVAYTLIRIIAPDYVNMVIGNCSFGYFSFFTQFPCFCIGVRLYFDYVSGKGFLFSKDLIRGILSLIIAVVVFFKPIFPFSYAGCAYLTAISAYYIIRAMISYEDEHMCSKFSKVGNFLQSIGQKSLYIFLVHAFFAWTFVEIFKNMVDKLPIVIATDTYVVYFILFPVVVALSYIAGTAYRNIVAFIVRNIKNGIQTYKLKT
jgi:hypothetical protein